MRAVHFVVFPLLAVAFSGCLVPDNMQTLREDLGFTTLDAPVVAIRASSLAPAVRQTVTFTASAPFGASLVWSLAGESATGEVVERAFDAPGTYAVSVRATMPDGAVGADRVTVSVQPNRAPIAHAAVAGAPRAAPGEALTFTAAASSDPDGHPLSFEWVFDDGVRTSGAQVQHAFAEPGVHEARLVASDGLDTSEAVVRVAIDQSVGGRGRATVDRAYELEFVVAPGAQALTGAVGFARTLMVEDVEVALRAPDGSVTILRVDPGVGTPTARVPVDLAAPLPGAWGLTVRMARGVGADVETALTVAYTA